MTQTTVPAKIPGAEVPVQIVPRYSSVYCVRIMTSTGNASGSAGGRLVYDSRGRLLGFCADCPGSDWKLRVRVPLEMGFGCDRLALQVRVWDLPPSHRVQITELQAALDHPIQF